MDSEDAVLSGKVFALESKSESEGDTSVSTGRETCKESDCPNTLLAAIINKKTRIIPYVRTFVPVEYILPLSLRAIKAVKATISSLH